MNFKRVSAAALALAMTASLGAAALADEPIGIVPISAPLEGDQPLLIAPAPADGADGAESGDTLATPGMPTVDIPAPNGGYKTALSVNGEALESFDFDHEIPGWGSQIVTWKISELDTVPAGYIPLRAVIQADGGSAYWDSYEYSSSFYYESSVILANFNDMSVAVNDEKVEGAQAMLLNGVTYVPVTVLEKLEGVTVTDNSTAAGENYEITTPNGTPMMKLATAILEAADMGRGMKATPDKLEEFYGEATGFQAEYMTEGVAFLPMMTSPDTLVLGKLAEGKEEALKECFETYRKTQEETFSWYLSHNLPKVENAQFVTEGDWFMFLIGENAEEAVQLFRDGVKALAEA